MLWFIQIAHGCGAVLAILLLAPVVLAATEPGKCSLSGTGGWGVAGVRQDVATGREWTLLEECGHPERPLRAVLTAVRVERVDTEKKRAEAVKELAPLVVAGHAVRVT
jgi:hypothetical protein